MIYEYDANGCTKDAVRIYKENKDKIGDIESATMKIIEEEPVLTLYDACGEGISIVSGF